MEGEKCYSEEFGQKNICRVKNVRSVKKEEASKDVDGEFIGILKLSERGSEIFHNELTELEKTKPEVLEKWDLNDFINHLIEKKHEVFLEYFKGKWKDIDSIEDLTYLINLQSKE